jgi:hypothetical protein
LENPATRPGSVRGGADSTANAAPNQASIYGARTTVKLAAYGAPGRRIPLQPIAAQPVRMIYTAAEFMINPNLLNRLMAFMDAGPYYQDEGVDFLAYNLKEVGQRMANTRIVAKASMLLNGDIYWDADGNILPNSSGAADSYGSIIPASHQGQLPCLAGSASIISAPWSLANTDILSQIRVLQIQSAQDTGLRIAHALYGELIPSFFQTNQLLQPYLARNANWRDTLVDTGDIPPMFGGIKKWTNISTAFFQDNNGVIQLLTPTNEVVFTPELGAPDKMDWYGMFEGSAAVLRGLDVYADAMGALANCPQEYGMSAFAVPTLQPPIAVTIFLQDVSLPVIRNEPALYQAITSF